MLYCSCLGNKDLVNTNYVRLKPFLPSTTHIYPTHHYDYIIKLSCTYDALPHLLSSCILGLLKLPNTCQRGLVELLILGLLALVSARFSRNTSQVQDDRKVTQPILKYLLMFSIQYNSIGLINTQYRCNYTRAHAGYVML
jgi:hypothetical protein